MDSKGMNVNGRIYGYCSYVLSFRKGLEML